MVLFVYAPSPSISSPYLNSVSQEENAEEVEPASRPQKYGQTSLAIMTGEHFRHLEPHITKHPLV